MPSSTRCSPHSNRSSGGGQRHLGPADDVRSQRRAHHRHAERGITDRFRSLPIAPWAVVAGRATADMLNGVVGLVGAIWMLLFR